MKQNMLSVSTSVLSRMILGLGLELSHDVPWEDHLGEPFPLPRPGRLVLGGPYPIPWREISKLRTEVDSLVRSYQGLSRQIAVLSDEKSAAQANRSLVSRFSLDIDELCPRPWPFPWPRPPGWDFLISGALILETAGRIKDASLRPILEQGAAKLMEAGLKELEVPFQV